MNAGRSAGLVRRWVSMYTRGLPADARQERRDEIEADLWSQGRDAALSGHSDSALGGEILARLLLGMPADLTWRLEQRRRVSDGHHVERRSHVNTRPSSAVAFFGGVCWFIWPIITEMRGEAAWTDPGTSWVMFVTVVVGTWALALATIGLVVAFQDRLPGPIAASAVIAVSVASLGVLGPYALALLLPVGSGLAAWGLRDRSALGPWLVWSHVFAAAALIVALAVAVAYSPIAAASPLSIVLLVGTMPYAFSWMAIGWAMLRVVRVADEPAT